MQDKTWVISDENEGMELLEGLEYKNQTWRVVTEDGEIKEFELKEKAWISL